MPATPVIPFRVRIGITGHRSLPNPTTISSVIRDILPTVIPGLFEKILPIAQSHTPFTFTVISALSEGADRVVAKPILEMEGADLEAILPMPEIEYEKDFQIEISRAEFTSLLSKASVKKVFCSDIQWNDVEAAELIKEKRRDGFEKAGRYIVDHCDVLIAVWDGLPGRGRGGTAENVAYAREKNRSIIVIPPDRPEAYLIEKRKLLHSDTYHRLNEFNLLQLRATQYSLHAKSPEEDLESPEGMEIPSSVKTMIRDSLIPVYAKASFLAMKSQTRYYHTGSLVYLLSPLAISSVVIGLLVPSITVVMCLSEIAVLLAIFIMIYRADKNRVHHRWVEARFLAERLRFAVYSAACGITPSPVVLPPLMTADPGSLDWMTRVYNEVIHGLNLHSDAKNLWGYVSFIRVRLLENQLFYHQNLSHQRTKKSKRLEMIGLSVFFAALVLAGLHFYVSLPGSEAIKEWVEYPMLFLVIVLPSVGAAIGGHRAHREYSRLADMNRSMMPLISEMDEGLRDVRTWEEFVSVMQDIEGLMLRENRDWMNLMRFAKVQSL